MIGLVMIKEYLDEILDGKKNNDVRVYDTRNRGRIALIDTKRSAVIGFVDLVGTHEISPEEYALWHLTGKWENSSFQVDTSRIYYSYDFANPIKLDKPIKIDKNGKTWCVIDDGLLVEKLETQISLF